MHSGQGRIPVSDDVGAIGPQLAGYRILRPLGRGGTGKVYLARQERLDRLVAIKVLDSELADEEGFIQRFSLEAQAAAMFQHPHVVPIYDASHDAPSNTHFIAFEYMPAGSLEDLLAVQERLSERRALEIVRAIADALAFAEDRKLLHRDVKPGNILLSADGTPKLSDLGLARRTDQGPGSMTQAGMVVGTPYYMAPEQALGRVDLDIRADIYSLGLCLWRMLTGLIPFVGPDEKRPSVIEALTRRLSEELPDVRSVAPEVSERTAALLKGMVARRRQERYRTAAQVRENVARILAGEGVAEPSVTDSADHLPATRAAAKRAVARVVGSDPEDAALPTRRTPWLALAATLGVGILIGAALNSSFGRRPPEAVGRLPQDPAPALDGPEATPAVDPPADPSPPLDPPPPDPVPVPVDPTPSEPPPEDPPTVEPTPEEPEVPEESAEPVPEDPPPQPEDPAPPVEPPAETPLILGPPLEYTPERASELSLALLTRRDEGVGQLARLTEFERDPAGRAFVAAMRDAVAVSDGSQPWSARRRGLRTLVPLLRDLPPGAGRSARTVRAEFGRWEQVLDCALALRAACAQPAGREGVLELFAELPPELGYQALARRILDLVERVDSTRNALTPSERAALTRELEGLRSDLSQTALGGVLHDELSCLYALTERLLQDPRSALIEALDRVREAHPESALVAARLREVPTDGALSDMPGGAAILRLGRAPEDLVLDVGGVVLELRAHVLRLGDQRLQFDWSKPRKVYVAPRARQLLVRIPDGDPQEVVLEREFAPEVAFTVQGAQPELVGLELLRRPSKDGSYRPRRGEALRALLEE
ncbi:MAG: serine/threonine-protein kinase [Planctomycetota bacterium]